MVNSSKSINLQAATMFTQSPQLWKMRDLKGIIHILPLTTLQISVTQQTRIMGPLMGPKMTMRITMAMPMTSKPHVTNKKISL